MMSRSTATQHQVERVYARVNLEAVGETGRSPWLVVSLRVQKQLLVGASAFQASALPALVLYEAASARP